MKLRYTVERQRAGEAPQRVSNECERSEIIIGRGSVSDIIIESRLASLRHARVTERDGEIWIEDLDSSAGLLVNNSPVKAAMLHDGDTVTIGDKHIQVRRSSEQLEFIERQEDAPKDLELQIKESAEALSIFHRLPSHRTLSLVAVVVIAALFAGYPLVTGNHRGWSAGPVSRPHQMIASDCKSCHATPFVEVQDKECLTCHTLTDHAQAFVPRSVAHHKNLDLKCRDCHVEHRGEQGLINRSPSACTSCHADLKRVFPNAAAHDVPSFSHHPEFTVELQPEAPGGNHTRVRLDASVDQLRDNSGIKFNHKKHLEPIRGPKGTVNLDCRSCHEPSDDLKTIKPISFERHCQECHTLGFDDAVPERELPHGDPDLIYQTLSAEYATITLSNQAPGRQVRETAAARTRPGGVMPSVGERPGVQEDFTRSFVEDQARRTEEQIFTKTACFVCHHVTPSTLTVQEAREKRASRFTLRRPQIPDRWMPQSIFSHRAHEEVACESCHAGVRRSSRTEDLLLPRLSDCTTCHTETGSHDTVRSDCVLCHNYHDPQVIPSSQKRAVKR